MRRALIIITLLGLLAGCGFHLRGSQLLPEMMSRTYLVGVAPYGDLAREVESSLQRGGGERVDKVASATARLSIVRDQFERRVLSVDANGKVSEYELNYQLEFSLHDSGGELQLGPQTITLQREFAFDSANVLGKGDEENLLRGELRRAAVEQMFRRLRRVGQGG